MIIHHRRRPPNSRGDTTVGAGRSRLRSASQSAASTVDFRQSVGMVDCGGRRAEGGGRTAAGGFSLAGRRHHLTIGVPAALSTSTGRSAPRQASARSQKGGAARSVTPSRLRAADRDKDRVGHDTETVPRRSRHRRRCRGDGRHWGAVRRTRHAARATACPSIQPPLALMQTAITRTGTAGQPCRTATPDSRVGQQHRTARANGSRSVLSVSRLLHKTNASPFKSPH